MWPNKQFPADFVTFTEEILHGKLHFLCSVLYCIVQFRNVKFKFKLLLTLRWYLSVGIDISVKNRVGYPNYYHNYVQSLINLDSIPKQHLHVIIPRSTDQWLLMVCRANQWTGFYDRYLRHEWDKCWENTCIVAL